MNSLAEKKKKIIFGKVASALPDTFKVWSVEWWRTIRKAREKFATSKSSFFWHMTAKDQIVFAKRLAILIKSGVPIVESLNMLEQQAGGKAGARVMRDLRMGMEQGQTLAAGMRSCRNIFGDFSVNVVDMGEMSGTLAYNLQYLAAELKKRQELRRNIVSALVYPSFLALASIGIVIMLVVYVFPKVLPIYRSFKYQLPWSTRFFVAATGIAQSYWVWIVLSAIIAGISVIFLFRFAIIRFWFDRNILRLPLLGPLFVSYSIANFSRTTGLLLESGIGIIETLRIIAGATGNTAYRLEIVKLADGVARGEKLSDMMARDPVLFPMIVRQLVAVGETAGSLSSSLSYLAEMYEEEMNNLARNLATSLEPILMVFMGLIVGFIALSIITPIYGITQSFRP